MKRISKYHREIKIAYIKAACYIILACFFLCPSFHKIIKNGNNMYTVYLNDTMIGKVSSEAKAKEYLQEARALLNEERNGLVYSEVMMSTEGEEAFFGTIDSKEEMVQNMCTVLKEKEITDRSLAYTIKINEFTLNLRNSDEVKEVLQAAIDKYDTSNEFLVDLVLDPNREINVLTTKITTSEDRETEEVTGLPESGIANEITLMDQQIDTEYKDSFDDYEYGIVDIEYGDTIEVIETYLKADQISEKETAKKILTENQTKNTIYEVQVGDTLSEIAITTNIPLDQIIAMNDTLENENSTIRYGDELIVTMQEPVLSVEREEEVYLEEDYDAEIQYVYNDDWYTTDSVVLQQPSSGHRNVAALAQYRNDDKEEMQVLKEEVIIEPVAKIVEIGTKIPPTYIKPISGGRLSSPFGRRSAPTAGASTYHKGVDWATPVGTAIVASCGGTVSKAGWGSGYGYIIYINHPDGRQTRYAHLSKILVRAGEHVSQGQKIALSGNTGRSTGPHLHFEILIDGTAVNPITHLN